MHVMTIDMAPPKTPNAPRGIVHGASAQNLITFTVRAAPLPKPIAEFLRDNTSVLRRLRRERVAREALAASASKANAADTLAASVDGLTLDGQVFNSVEDLEAEEEEELDVQTDVVRAPTVRLEQFWPALEALCTKAGGEWTTVPQRVWAFGPHGAGSCLLVDARGVSGLATSCVHVCVLLLHEPSTHVEVI
jgi:ribosome assembly protein 1